MLKLKKVYVPRGKASEYAELAVNIFEGCDHNCSYCYASKMLRKDKEEFHASMIPRAKILEDLRHDAKILEGDERKILLCFTCDIYAKGTTKHSSLVTEALTILLEHGLNINILTKGGTRSLRDYDLLLKYKDQVTMGASLVFRNDTDALQHEPNAAITSDRCRALYQYYRAGIKTWVSLEPVWSDEDACGIIDITKNFTDSYKIGKLNYHPNAKEIDWEKTIMRIKTHCIVNEVDYMLKKDTAKLVE